MCCRGLCGIVSPSHARTHRRYADTKVEPKAYRKLDRLLAEPRDGNATSTPAVNDGASPRRNIAGRSLLRNGSKAAGVVEPTLLTHRPRRGALGHSGARVGWRLGVASDTGRPDVGRMVPWSRGSFDTASADRVALEMSPKMSPTSSQATTINGKLNASSKLAATG
jgi:hypothetical protein